MEWETQRRQLNASEFSSTWNQLHIWTTELSHFRQATRQTYTMSRQKISGTHSAPSTPLALSGFEQAIHHQLDAMDQDGQVGSKPPAITSAHEDIRKKLLARTTLIASSTGYTAIHKRTSSTTGNQRYTIELTNNMRSDQDNSPAILLERSQEEVELHLLLESHFRTLESGSAPDLNATKAGQKIRSQPDEAHLASTSTATPKKINAPANQPGLDPQAGTSLLPSRIALPNILPQTGHICKPTSLATIDLFYADVFKVPPIPLRKNGKRNPAMTPTGASTAPAIVSVREIAKRHRSRQGEVLDAADYAQIAEEMGYSVKRFHPQNVTEFAALVAKHLQRRQPLTTCFAVDASTGLPTRRYQDNEHACVITGINPIERTLDIAHWGRTFANISIDDMYASMNALPATREPEFYSDEKHAASGGPAHPQNYKYDKCTPEQASTASRTVLKSITPGPDTGFKNRVFVMQPMLMHARWLSMPAE